MPNAKQTLTTLLSSLEAAFSRYPEEDANLFNSQFNGALDLSRTNQTQIYGHTNTTIINSLRSALQAVSSGTSSPETATGAWNPIIAAVFNTLEKCVLELDHDDDVSSRVTGVNVDTTKSSGQLKKISTTGGLPKRPSQKVETVATVPLAKPVPIARARTPLSVCPNDVISRVRAAHVKNAGNGPVFKNLQHYKCTAPKCTFCENLWMALDLTKCSEITCHRKGSVCNRDGWNAHVFPTMWLAASKDHDAGLDFPGLSKYAPKPVREGGSVTVTTATTSVSTSSLRKRTVTYADQCKAIPMDESPHSPKMTKYLGIEEGVSWLDDPSMQDLSLDTSDLESGELN